LMPATVELWLKEVGLDEYGPAFKENDITLELLTELDKDDLKDLGVKSFGHRKLLLIAIAALKSSNQEKDLNNGSDVLVTSDKTEGNSTVFSSLSAVSNEAERRQITVMFCDLIGSTELSQLLDMEDLRNLNRAYQEACRKCIESYEGFVTKYMGDGVLAYFGYPIAHEDDSERSIHAARAIIDAIGKLNEQTGSMLASDSDLAFDLSVRIGIATGAVVVGDLIGEGASRENAVVGETPNLAARLEAIAEPNTMVISAATRQLAGGSFAYLSLGDQSLKGIKGTVEAWTVTGAQDQGSRFETLHEKSISPLIGREEEHDMLARRWSMTQKGNGQVVLVSGEAGIGKSRLTRGLRERAEDTEAAILNYQCSPYHTSSALYPVINHFERGAGFSTDDTSDARLDKLEAFAKDTDLVEPDRLMLLAELLSLPTNQR
jgi:class 3 adenylate cyclase